MWMLYTYLCASTECTDLYDVKERAPSFLKTIKANESEPASLNQSGCTSQCQNLQQGVCVCVCVCVHAHVHV